MSVALINANKRWTKEDEEYLKEHWGKTTMKSISWKLRRTRKGVILKAYRMGLPKFYDNDSYVTLYHLSQFFGRNHNDVNLWIKHGIPYTVQKCYKASVKITTLDEFWEWADEHRGLLNFSYLKPHDLEWEPEWVKTQRELDKERYKTSEWTTGEIKKLKQMLQTHNYTVYDISSELNRSAGGIQFFAKHHQIEGGFKREIKRVWCESDINDLIYYISMGYQYCNISKRFHRNDTTVRDCVLKIFGISNLDKIRVALNKYGINNLERVRQECMA